MREVLREAFNLRMPGDLRSGLNLSMIDIRLDEESLR